MPHILINRPPRRIANVLVALVIVLLVAANSAQAFNFPRDTRYPRRQVAGWAGHWGPSGLYGDKVRGTRTHGLYHMHPATLPHVGTVKF